MRSHCLLLIAALFIQVKGVPLRRELAVEKDDKLLKDEKDDKEDVKVAKVIEIRKEPTADSPSSAPQASIFAPSALPTPGPSSGPTKRTGDPKKQPVAAFKDSDASPAPSAFVVSPGLFQNSPSDSVSHDRKDGNKNWNFVIEIRPWIPTGDLTEALMAYLNTEDVLLTALYTPKEKTSKGAWFPYQFSVITPNSATDMSMSAIIQQDVLETFLQVHFDENDEVVSIRSVEIDGTISEQSFRSSRGPRSSLLAALIVGTLLCCGAVSIVVFVIPRCRKIQEQRKQWVYSEEKESRILLTDWESEDDVSKKSRSPDVPCVPRFELPTAAPKESFKESASQADVENPIVTTRTSELEGDDQAKDINDDAAPISAIQHLSNSQQPSADYDMQESSVNAEGAPNAAQIETIEDNPSSKGLTEHNSNAKVQAETNDVARGDSGEASVGDLRCRAEDKDDTPDMLPKEMQRGVPQISNLDDGSHEQHQTGKGDLGERSRKDHARYTKPVETTAKMSPPQRDVGLEKDKGYSEGVALRSDTEIALEEINDAIEDSSSLADVKIAPAEDISLEDATANETDELSLESSRSSAQDALKETGANEASNTMEM